MSYAILRNALTRMRATGEDGFEGLCATLLSAVTGDRFYIARSGDQPADAVSDEGDIAIQGKRYYKTPLDETEFEGDFHKACRLCPKLDCYVLAATRTTAQLAALANEMERITGVDILLLGFGETDSELPALCISYWEKIRHFHELSQLDSDFTVWVTIEAVRPEIRATVNRVRTSLTQSASLAATVRRQLNSYLDIRFQINSSSNRPLRFPIDLPHSVPRREPRRLLHEWWSGGQTKAAAIIGEEGMGKSLVTADFSNHLIRDGGALILWLDSADWAGLANLDAVIDAGFMLAGFTDRHLRERLVRKAGTRWCDCLLVVLDGINERGARETWHRILAQLNASQPAQCRLLFTTRPIQWKSDEQSLWNSTARIPLGRFTEEELCEALKHLPNPVARDELPNGLLEIATIPRYFRRSIELRERFKSFANVSKEMVLWADLLAKVEAGDPQLTDKIGWNSTADVKRALITLADAARSHRTAPTAYNDSYSLLQASFGEKYEQIRSDLAEQRVVLEPTGDNPTPSMEHVILGFALHLGRLAAKSSNQSAPDLADTLRKELEPVLSQDQLTESLFVALQLSAFPAAQGHVLDSKSRTALLLAWTSSQNSRVELDRLSFWANEDAIAYMDFVEELLVEPVSDAWQELLVSPLADEWVNSHAYGAPLDIRLRRWLKLVWKSHDLPKSAEMTHEGIQLPIARSASQLDLSFAAIAILGRMPLESFLPDLAIAWATASLSTKRYFFPKHPNGPVEKSDDVSCKELGKNLGPLLRWRYTELVRPAIESLQKAHPEDKVLQKGLDYMIDAFDSFGWTRCWVPEKHLRDGIPLFHGKPAECRNHFPNCPELAVREDLPSLCENDQAIIQDRVETAFVSIELKFGYSRTSTDHEMENFLSWFARYRQKELAEQAARFRLRALDLKEIGPALDFANQLPYSSATVSPAELLAKAKKCVEREYAGTQPRFSWSTLQLHILAFTCYTEPELQDWLTFASGHTLLRREIFFYPLPLLCPLVVPQSIAEVARDQTIKFADDPPGDGDISQACFDYWASIAGLSGEPDEKYHQWVDQRIHEKQPTGNRLFHWLLLWFRSATKEQIDVALANGSLLKVLGNNGWRAMWMTEREVFDWTKLSANFNEVIERLPIDDAGTVLLLGKRHADLDQWGNLLFNKALQLAGHPPFDRKFWGATVHTANLSGEIVSSTCSDKAPRDTPNQSLRPAAATPWAFLSDPHWGEKHEQQANEGIRLWRDDQQSLDKIEAGAFARFSAVRALETWRDRNPKAFCEYSNKLLTHAVTNPMKAFHLGTFIATVTDVLVPLDPKFAAWTDQQLHNSSMRVNVINEYGVSTFHATLWRESGKGNVLCRNLCETLLKLSNTDEELMTHAITAQAEGAGKVLADLCDDFLSAKHAKDRCLAVSLLAWMPDPAQSGILDKLAGNDSSGWVRKHAEWAAEVTRQEIALRSHYEQTLREQDRNIVLARLQVLLPALTPSARWWHLMLENRIGIQNFAPSIRAASALFWQGSENECKKTPELFGRKLNEYLRGERIHDIRSPQLQLLEPSIAKQV
jgi:hypothetical protein